jgi:hypothetical protein
MSFESPNTRLLRASVLAIGLCTTTAALASPTVALNSAVFVERVTADRTRNLVPARQLTRGDRVVYVLSWTKLAGDGGFTVTNPLPSRVAFQDSAADNAEISVDGGRSWGRMGTLRIADRLATPDDVTHVRWRIDRAIAAQRSGQIAYSAIVR